MTSFFIASFCICHDKSNTLLVLTHLKLDSFFRFLISCFFFFECLHFTFNSKGMLLAKDIRDRERGGRAEIRIIEGEAESDSPQSMEILTAVLGQRSSELPEGTPDANADQEQKSKLTLYQWVPFSALMMPPSPYPPAPAVYVQCCMLPWLFVLSCVSVCPMLKDKWRSRKSLPDHWARTSSTMMWGVFLLDSFSFKILALYQS